MIYFLQKSVVSIAAVKVRYSHCEISSVDIGTSKFLFGSIKGKKRGKKMLK